MKNAPDIIPPTWRWTNAGLLEPLSSRSKDTGAKEKKSTMETYWVPGVNHLGTYGRWSFAEFTDIYEIQSDFAAKVESEYNKIMDSVTSAPAAEQVSP
jgi:hypothetical protein